MKYASVPGNFQQAKFKLWNFVDSNNGTSLKMEYASVPDNF